MEGLSRSVVPAGLPIASHLGLTQGGGAWGSTVWAWNRQNPLGNDDQPACCTDN